MTLVFLQQVENGQILGKLSYYKSLTIYQVVLQQKQVHGKTSKSGLKKTKNSVHFI